MSEASTHIAFRMPNTLLARVDAYHAEMEARLGGVVKLTRADAIRALVSQALEALDGQPSPVAPSTPSRPTAPPARATSRRSKASMARD